ncbi:MAG: aminotransferase class I/II-fold pyridoxal phosphate-dependent enzyme, partial [Deltaproteobacteria bacterium]|nr:aminotransferase class I/II-fold pyridoxal phosphate-dependent enzyme [Deltaproteobacteria bacterium]
DAIYNADFGDDVYGEDPSTNRLEKMAAKMVGKEDAILVPSGTMGNLISLLVHCRRGDEIILGDQAHIFYYEVGGMSALGGIVPHTVTNQPDGTMRLEDIETAIRGDNIHYPRTRLICLENTHNRCNGMPITVEYTDSVRELANRYGVGVHLDGARIFNAAVALGVPICSSSEFITEARRVRKILGGGMRQTGIIAAAGIVALEEMTKHLADDHANARRLAGGIAGIPGLKVDLENVRTNIVFFHLENDGLTEDDFMARLEARGVKLLHLGSCQFRMVTHHGITAEDIDLALEILKDVVG